MRMGTRLNHMFGMWTQAIVNICVVVNLIFLGLHLYNI